MPLRRLDAEWHETFVYFYPIYYFFSTERTFTNLVIALVEFTVSSFSEVLGRRNVFTFLLKLVTGSNQVVRWFW